ncbi:MULTISPECIES: MurR/RpiR family transcriptional regulator [unclassified Mesorhizobium]|uniref:MurR/RpiR family transcriptional regulator n=1 Tax=unclassified Mesorhizobium TaxID=325217 RepID=UPI00112CCAE6|nr:MULTISPECIES: MurR/RpiR family transcriptional regulator [unclassified Mesorhizobium]MBZ9704316.1 MurR/RpiR family transcriptional regulator [Mesorhizobium sp. CO1-1-3]MBZ9896057.1 MurR/RpiR family transcriptional regulator [Mesorhizobium sp. BR1-1-6]MBZ9950853.1 MurR/RpiR family transcriptional regulator [Mesorhizobium sp. BR1-1-11]TPI95078.1 MurR/RpiR family transcriptional regulator [Mesorhizobium sp. B2-8-1]TPK46395.1 MurR/RpiR family transcriptional regulator [Mesorhizobium sp. B2-5-2]
MLEPAFRSRLLESFETMPRQLRAAAQWVLDNPRDVALLSMRVQAQRAGVTPASMTRLAQRMGFDGYDSLRDLYAEQLRRGEKEFLGKAEALMARRKRGGDGALAFELAETLERHMAKLCDPATLEAVTRAASVLAGAKRIYALGYRSSYPVACHFAYVYGLAGGAVRLLDGVGGTGPDPLWESGAGDVLLAISVKPYTRAAVELVDYARSRALEIVAITDSVVSPLVNRAGAVIIVPTESPSFFHTMAPAFAIAETLAAILAAAAGDRALAAMRDVERQFDTLSTHIYETRQRS